MNSNQFRRWLAGQECTFEVGEGKGGHIKVRRGERWTVMPMHGGAKQLGTGLMRKIRKDLEID